MITSAKTQSVVRSSIRNRTELHLAGLGVFHIVRYACTTYGFAVAHLVKVKDRPGEGRPHLNCQFTDFQPPSNYPPPLWCLDIIENLRFRTEVFTGVGRVEVSLSPFDPRPFSFSAIAIRSDGTATADLIAVEPREKGRHHNLSIYLEKK